MSNFVQLCGAEDATFLLRWRGRQEGPYPASAIEAKLVANEIGLLHEITHNGQWVTIRDYIAEREAVMRAEKRARQEQELREREVAEKFARERDEKLRAATLFEERRKNDLMAAGLARDGSSSSQAPLKPHRGGLVLTLGLIGLFVFGPLCLAAWVMGSSDLNQMNARTMDASGRSTTSTARNIGILGTILWVAGFLFFVFAAQIHI